MASPLCSQLDKCYTNKTVIRARAGKCEEPIVFVEIILLLLQLRIFEGLTMHEKPTKISIYMSDLAKTGPGRGQQAL